jgi:hypothetical protein
MLLALDRRNVTLNRLSVPANTAKERAKKAARPLFMKSSQPGWGLVGRGASTLYQVFGRSFVIFTRHQFGMDDVHFQLEDAFVCLNLESSDLETKYLRGDLINNYLATGDSEQEDLIVMHLPQEMLDERANSGAYFIQNPTISVTRPSEDILFMAVGYPDSMSAFELHDDEDRMGWLKHTKLKQVSVAVQWCGVTTGDLSDEYHFKPGQVLIGANTYSGFSGGPIIGFDRERREVFLAGIIITGGQGIFRAVNVASANRLCLAACKYFSR